MTLPAKTILYFGIYMIIEGLLLLLFPNLVLTLAKLPTTSEIWVHLVGLSLIILGVYYVLSARLNHVKFFKWTVPIRVAQFFVVLLLILFEKGQLPLLLFSGIEAIAGLWTWWALQKKPKKRSK
jgi:uncharacterized protein YjeT (DUF2065 family)